MSRILNKVNRRIIERTLELLNLEPEHNVLEIGFGGGTSLPLVASKLPRGKITGIDLSPEMVAQAQRNLRPEIEAGRVALQVGDVSSLPFPDATFERVFTVNTIYFWSDTMAGLAEIRRVLKPKGMLAIAIRSKEKMENKGVSKYNFRLFSKDEVADHLQRAGFRDIRIDHKDQHHIYDQVVVIGCR